MSLRHEPIIMGRQRDQDGVVRQHRDVSRGRQLCIMACVFCADPMFWKWMSSIDAAGDVFNGVDEARAFIVTICGVTSRNELDTDAAAGKRFLDLVRAPYMAWKDGQPPEPGRALP